VNLEAAGAGCVATVHADFSSPLMVGRIGMAVARFSKKELNNSLDLLADLFD